MSNESGGLSPSDVALLQNRNNDGFGFGGDGAWWIVLFLIFGLGGWGGMGGFGGGFGGWGGMNGFGNFNEYAWLSNGQKEIMQNTNQGFDTLQLTNQLSGINNGVQGLSTQLCGCCADINQNLCNGFANTNQTVNSGFANTNQTINSGFANTNQTINSGFANAETSANARQMANMQQSFNNQLATIQGLNGINSSIAATGCDIREGIAGVNYNNAIQTQTITSQIASENCADRAALSDGIRDLLANQTANTQRILDQLCNDKIDAKNEKIADLERQLSMADLKASQVAQNAFIAQGFSNEVDQLYNRLNSCPVPSTPVYGRTPIFTCNNNGCGCGCNGNM